MDLKSSTNLSGRVKRRSESFFRMHGSSSSKKDLKVNCIVLSLMKLMLFARREEPKQAMEYTILLSTSYSLVSTELTPSTTFLSLVLPIERIWLMRRYSGREGFRFIFRSIFLMRMEEFRFFRSILSSWKRINFWMIQ